MFRLTQVSLCSLLLLISQPVTFSSETNENKNDDLSTELLKHRLYDAKMELWSRGEFDMMGQILGEIKRLDYHSDLKQVLESMKRQVSWASVKLGPVRKLRRDFINQGGCLEFDCPVIGHSSFFNRLINIRGGTAAHISDKDYNKNLEDRLNELAVKHGPDFVAAIKLNEEEHAKDCETSCHSFYCAPPSKWDQNINPLNSTTITSYSFGPTPPEDFAEIFGFPLDLIKVTEGEPIFSANEAADVIKLAEEDGIEQNEFPSGKYKLAGDWLLNLPKTRAWFNRRLETTLFPLMAHLFPEVLSSPSVLRAHSVSLLKYNSSHPRTDVHIDNGILAMTLAMTSKEDYNGGGTFFEHMGSDNILEMDVGHGTFRPGSVRHGGQKVTKGTRYILGAFLLVTNRVEHVRRLKNRGSELRSKGDFKGAVKHFEWALDINPKCITCLKDWAEILSKEKKFSEAESKVRKALELLEEKDSDALFSLGVILSEQGKDDESIEAYSKSIQLNGEDAQLCYNLGIKLGAKGDRKEEMKMYARATTIDSTFGGAWLNWGTSLAESGDIENAEVMFLKASTCTEVKAKAMINLALVHQKKANLLAAQGDLNTAKIVIEDAVRNLENAKPLLEEAIQTGLNKDEDERYIAQFGPLRLACHRMMGYLYLISSLFDRIS